MWNSKQFWNSECAARLLRTRITGTSCHNSSLKHLLIMLAKSLFVINTFYSEIRVIITMLWTCSTWVKIETWHLLATLFCISTSSITRALASGLTHLLFSHMRTWSLSLYRLDNELVPIRTHTSCYQIKTFANISDSCALPIEHLADVERNYYRYPKLLFRGEYLLLSTKR